MLERAQKIVVYDEIRSLNGDVSQLENQISTLQGELMRLKSRRANLLSQVAPIWMVPIELLSHIFKLGYQDIANFFTERFGSEPVGVDLTFPITISHVCRHFRNVSLMTPILWTGIRVEDFTNAQLHYIETCLQRSSTLPLNIVLHYSTYIDSVPPNSGIDQAMILIRANMHRLERFSADFLTDDVVYHVLKYFDRPTARLTTLKLSAGDVLNQVPSDDDDDGLLVFGNGMDRLTSLRMTCVPKVWSQRKFKNLVVLSLSGSIHGPGLECREFWTLIENSPSLRELCLEHITLLDPIAVSANHGPCILNSLKKLELRAISLNDSQSLISRLRVPNLQSLILGYLVSDNYSSFLNRFKGPPLLFPNLTLLRLELVKGGDAAPAALDGLRGAYFGFKRWLVLSRGPIIALFASLGDDDTVKESFERYTNNLEP